MLALLLLSFSICAAPGFCEEVQYTHEVVLKGVSFHWKTTDDLLHIKLIAETTGWVGIGFNPTKHMLNADFIIGYVKNGKVKVVDHYGISERRHKNDSKLGGENHVTDISGKEENDTTEIRFAIPLDSGDSNDKPLSLNSETIVLLAYGAGRDSFKSRHKFRTTLRVNLKTGEYKE
jgi:hypothetical protein